METVTQIAMAGFAAFGFGWLAYLIGKHGWAWVAARFKARAAAAEAALKAKAVAGLGDIDARIKDVVHSEIAKIESDLAALKAKAGV